MATNHIDRAVRDAQLALELARMKRDTRAEGEALRTLQSARTRQMKRDKRQKRGEFSPEAQARQLPVYDSAARRTIRETFRAARTAAVVAVKVAAVGLYLGGLAGLALGAQLLALRLSRLERPQNLPARRSASKVGRSIP